MRRPLALLALLSACTTAPTRPEPKPADPLAPPMLRLPGNARPLRYALDLNVSPGDTAFTGVATIDIELRQAVPVIWLHATELAFTSATLNAGGASEPVRVLPGGKDFVGLAPAQPVGPGRVSVRLEYAGPVSAKESRGLFRQKEGADWFAFTQFEATDARRAFPCFDEPSYKAPWSLTLHVPEDLLAVANAPVASEAREANGRKAVRFVETPPLASYLVAFAVGPFEAVDAGRAGEGRIPVRILAPRGKGAEARLAAEITPQIVAVLEDYFGSPFPYPKLDLVGIPEFFGAMENPGLVTYTRSVLLATPAEETARQRRTFADVTAHELAHHWFGDQVTLAWWDDLWLNESFASWMESKVLRRYQPAWGQERHDAASRMDAMGADSLQSARAVRQPIESNDDIQNAFDAITYAKGAAVLFMFERYLGEEAFQQGVRRFLAAHREGNATSADFFAALSEAARQPVGAAFASLLDRPGVPLLEAELRCGAGGARLELSQRRYLPLGSKAQADADVWRLPVCARWGAGGKEARACTLLEAERGALALGQTCPEWLLPDDGLQGYYAVRAGPELAARLAKASPHLSAAERLGLLGEAQLLAGGGQLPVQEALARVAPLFGPGEALDHEAVKAATALVASLRGELVPPGLQPNYRRYIQRTFGAQAHALGLLPRPGEDDEARLSRAALLGLTGDEGEDAALRAEARRLAERYLADPTSVPPDEVPTVLTLAALDGDAALFERMLARARQAPDVNSRRRLLIGLGSFLRPELLERSLALSLDPGFDPREALLVLELPLARGATRDRALGYLEAHLEALSARLPEDDNAAMPALLAGACDAAHRAQVERLFGPRASHFQGGPRLLAQALESIDLCIAAREAQLPGVTAFLKDY